MHRVVYLVPGLLLILSALAAPAGAGEYRAYSVWSSGCCGTVVLYERNGYVRYARPHAHRPRPYVRPRHCYVQQAAFKYAFYPHEPRC